MIEPRFVVGIDLGTTHTALAYAPRGERGGAPVVLDVPQLVARGTLDARPLLPSFLYVASEGEGPLALPWDEARGFAVGELARSAAVDSPSRVVASAKSWLSHPTADRRAPLLPLHAPEDVPRMSPVEASQRILAHLREAWDREIARGDEALALEHQEIVLTVPASFDPAARSLTTEAAFAAGLQHLTLLEEPQAALYAWLAARGDGWRRELTVGDVILVVDVGGGTTDFSIIAVWDDAGSLALERVAVGDHILLGGDNMDLALAHRLAQKLAGTTLDRFQQAALGHAARAAKEALFSTSADAHPVAVAGKGSKLVGAMLRTELRRDELDETLVEGFFPRVAADARPIVRARSGFAQLGLPYAQDAAVTRHLAALLSRNAEVSQSPTRVLFNGGVMKADALRARVLDCLASWSREGVAPAELAGADLDLAVARGAVAYGLARAHGGARIRGGTARAYYVGIEDAAPAVPGIEPPLTALCVAPFGMEEGTHAALPSSGLGVVVGESVRFRFFGSTTRRDDGAGSSFPLREGELEELAPIEMTLPAEGRVAGDVVAVTLAARVTEVGTLVLEAVPEVPKAAGERWQLELSVRDEA